VIKIEPRGLEEVQRALAQISEKLPKEIKARVLSAGLIVAAEAKTNQIRKGGYKRIKVGGRTWIIPTPAPRAGMVFSRRGGLRRSINVQTEKRGNTWVSRTGTWLQYGKWLEFGTSAGSQKPHAIPLAVILADASKIRERAGRTLQSGEKALRPAWRIVRKRGPIKARFWLRKSFEAKEKQILAEVSRAVGDSIQ
jgi:hypothetical protein